MTIYEFSREYLRQQTARHLPQFPLDALELYNKPHVFSWPPFFTCADNDVTLYDATKLLAFTLQNRFNLPNVINFQANFEAIRTVTENFDPYTLALLTKEALAARFAEVLGIEPASPSWLGYCQGLVDAGKYILDQNFCYRQYLDKVRRDPEAVIAQLCRICGMGPALARNFLKELGATEFGKPDLHLMQVVECVEQLKGNPIGDMDYADFDIWLRQQVKNDKVTAYEFDRLIWLICTGDYFKHHVKIRRSHTALREDFLAALRSAVESGTVTV